MDSIDLRILSILQRDANARLAQIAAAVKLSPNPCWRRINKMESEGVITGRVALLDPAKLGAGTLVFIKLKTACSSEEEAERVGEAIAALPAITEVHRVTGGDLMLKAQIGRVSDYDRLYRRLIAVAPVTEINATFAMATFKQTTAIPLPNEDEGEDKRDAA
ncbi:Lrp/AsnC family transcriptional regulator [Sphingomonas sp.]|uniref:Lrp/AsnC family transcriptional regulator n=1 Tax=Sphingomonas sp. TaxID=28214 RepID=UPI0025DEEBBF|nr:Lrp/AsnC family transcriptional regulator [Sphingomonas sp.]